MRIDDHLKLEGDFDTQSENKAAFRIKTGAFKDRAKLVKEAGMAHIKPEGGIEEPFSEYHGKFATAATTAATMEGQMPEWFAWDKVGLCRIYIQWIPLKKTTDKETNEWYFWSKNGIMQKLISDKETNRLLRPTLAGLRWSP